MSRRFNLRPALARALRLHPGTNLFHQAKKLSRACRWINEASVLVFISAVVIAATLIDHSNWPHRDLAPHSYQS